MAANVSPASPQPVSGFSAPASVYVTVSRSGQTRSPWNQSSSPVFTTTVMSSGATTWTSPRRNRAAPTPPASAASTIANVVVATRDSAPGIPGPSRGGNERSSGGAVHEVLGPAGADLDGLLHLRGHG